MRIAIGADHAGYRYKEILAEELRDEGHQVVDVGTDSEASVDYPDYAEKVAEAVSDGRADRGILVCGSSVGVSVTANKLPGVRAATCHDAYSARQGVEHDDMNVLCLGERVIGIEVARDLVRNFLSATFSGGERHRRRLEKMKEVEARHLRTERPE